MAQKIKTIIWVGVTIVLMVMFVLHPRVYFVFMLLFSFYQTYSLVRKKKEIKLLSSFVALLIIWYIGNFFVVAFPMHAPYEYKSDIKQFKEKNSNYDHFPDEIPQGAKKVRWINMPSLMQGSGYEGLFFYADGDFLNAVFQKYKEKAKIYYANDSSYEISNIGFPMQAYIPAGTDTDLIVMVLYDNGDWNHHHINGLYLNMQEGYICYFCE